MSKVAAPAVLCEVEIKGRMYGVEPIDPGEDGTKAFVLHKPNGDSYAVLRRRDGIIACDCPDWVARRDGITVTPCKHGAALVALGFLEAPGAFDTTPTVREATPALSAAPEPCCGPEGEPCKPCAAEYQPTAEDLAEMGRWMAGEDLDIEPAELLALDAYIDHEADRFRKAGTLAGELIARRLAELASMVRFVRASHPATAMDRIAVATEPTRQPRVHQNVERAEA